MIILFWGRRWTDEQVEEWIGGLLRSGVLLAAAVALVGGIVYVAHNGGATADYRQFHGAPGGLDTLHGVVAGALALHARAVVQLGLLLLIATPIARVALSLFAFLRQHDRTYVLITAVVLCLLLYGLLGPGVG